MARYLLHIIPNFLFGRWTTPSQYVPPLTLRRYILGAATVTTLGVAVAVEASNKAAAKNAVKSTQTEADKRYQALLESYGSGESLSELENAVQNYKWFSSTSK
jgi:hypothetical protein